MNNKFEGDRLQTNNEQSEKESQREKIFRLKNCITSLPECTNDPRGMVNAVGISRVETALNIMVNLPENYSPEINNLKENILFECKQGLQTISYKDETAKEFLDEAKKILEELEAEQE